MSLYRYKARDKQGELITGTLEAPDEKGAAGNLDRMGYSVTEIVPAESGELSLGSLLERFKRPEKRDVIIFTRQLSALLRTGTALAPALTTIYEQTPNKRFKTVLGEVRQAVQEGTNFSEALSRHPHVFSELFISMVQVGEAGGLLDMVLDRVANLGTQELEMNSRIKSAMIYPVVLVVISFIVVNFLIIGVLPKFVTIFKSSGAALPLPTQIVLGLSWIMRKMWLPLAIGGGLIFLGLRGYCRTDAGRMRLHTLLLKLPIFGELYKKIQVSRFARTTAALVSSGVPILQALTVVEKTLTNVVIRQALQKIKSAISEGNSLGEPFRASGLFSPMVVQMISTGEKTGKLDQMLNEIVTFYDPEIEYTVKNMTALLEPFMLLAMGIMVGFIALSVLLPIFNLIKVFRG